LDSNIKLTITHLTTRQKALLEKLWSFDSLEDMIQYQLTLEPEDLLMSVSLVELIKVESIDQIQTESGDLSQAIEIIHRVKS
jgi:hypothetical protein